MTELNIIGVSVIEETQKAHHAVIMEDGRPKPLCGANMVIGDHGYSHINGCSILDVTCKRCLHKMEKANMLGDDNLMHEIDKHVKFTRSAMKYKNNTIDSLLDTILEIGLIIEEILPNSDITTAEGMLEALNKLKAMMSEEMYYAFNLTGTGNINIYGEEEPLMQDIRQQGEYEKYPLSAHRQYIIVKGRALKVIKEVKQVINYSVVEAGDD